MPSSSFRWEINQTSKFHFHEWPDGVALYLEGEGSTYLLDPFAAELLKWLIESGQLSTQAIIDKVSCDYPDDTREDITHIVEMTLNECQIRGFVTNIDK